MNYEWGYIAQVTKTCISYYGLISIQDNINCWSLSKPFELIHKCEFYRKWRLTFMRLQLIYLKMLLNAPDMNIQYVFDA